MVWGRAKAQRVRAGVPCVGGERVGRGAFSVSSVPEPLSTDMRSCWKAANPGGVSRGAAVAGVRAASAMGAAGAREMPPAERDEGGGHFQRTHARGHLRTRGYSRRIVLYFPTSHLCLSNLRSLPRGGDRAAALGLRMAPPLGALRVFVQHGTGLRAADLNGLADPYVKLTIRHMTRETRVVHECLDPRWEELVQFIGARRRAPVPRWSCARFPFPARGFPFHEGLFCC